jgi:hypothetical protein
MALCDVASIEPSLLLHPLDFLGADDDGDLGFFPAMQSPASKKLRFARKVLDLFCDRRRVVTLREHARKYATAPRSTPNVPSSLPQDDVLGEAEVHAAASG